MAVLAQALVLSYEEAEWGEPRSDCVQSDADICLEIAGKAGVLWKRYRKKAPPDVRDTLAEVLLRLRIYLVPTAELDCVGSIGRARYDIRGVTDLLRRIADGSGSSDSYQSSGSSCRMESPQVQDISDQTLVDFQALQTTNDILASF